MRIPLLIAIIVLLAKVNTQIVIQIVIPNCQIYDTRNSTKCNYCNQGYKVEPIQKTSCIVKSPILNCLTYGPSTSDQLGNRYERGLLVCTSCVTGYALSSKLNSCNLICPPQTSLIRYVVINGSCFGIDINCKKYDSLTGNCLSCIHTYELRLNLCVKKIIQNNRNGKKEK